MLQNRQWSLQCYLDGKTGNGLVPVYFKGQMSSDFLQDLVCTCKGKSVCMKGCICFEQSLSCTDLCPCQAGDLCRNENTHLAISRNSGEDDDIWSQFFFIQSPSISLNKTVVIKTMISDKTVFHFQHCDHQLTLVIVFQLPRLPVDVFCFIETWSNVCFRQVSLFSVLSKLRQVHTYYVFFSK